MSFWGLALAAGIGSSWGLDTLRQVVSLLPWQKVLGFFILDGVIWIVTLVVFPVGMSGVRATAGVLLSLGVGRVFHEVLATIQALKDKTRVEVMSGRRKSPFSG